MPVKRRRRCFRLRRTYGKRTCANRSRAYRDRGPVDAAAGIAGAVIGTAAAIATASFRGSYAYDNDYGYDNGYDNGYARRNGFVCQPGTWFRGEDGRRHLCQ
jgi:hypothetical protein